MNTAATRWGAGMAGLLAWRNQAHDRSRLVVTLVPPQLSFLLYGVTLVMCVLASVVSIRMAMSIDPAMVFQR